MSARSSLKTIGLEAAEILRRHVAAGYMSGAVAIIADAESAEVVFIGDESQEQSVRMRRDSIFRIASMTKPVTAVATLMLIEDGKLRLDEPIDRWLPELANRRVLREIDAPLTDTVPAKRAITVEDLLTFRCGLGDALAPDSYPIQRAISALQLIGFGPPDPSYPVSPDEWLQRVATLPLMAQPGERWLYNTGSCLLSVLLARVSGQPLPELLRKRLFEPLGMKDTAFFAAATQLDRLVSAYRLEAGRAVLYDAPATSAWKTRPAFPDGAAGLVSTADDYLAFARLLLAGGRVGGHRLLSEASVAAMLRDHLTARERSGGAPILSAGRGWGLGLSVVVEQGPEGLPAGCCGWSGGLGTTWMADPRTGLHAILLTQTQFISPVPPAVHQEFWHAVFSPTYL